MKPTLIYCYDAWCGWCYGFSSVMKKLAAEYAEIFNFEVLSGGMIPPANAAPVSKMSDYVLEAYKRVEEASGVKFGEDYLWHFRNPELSDWIPSSLKPAIALSILKGFKPERAVFFAADLQYALHYEGRDLTDDEAYRHLLSIYNIPADEFYENLRSDKWKEEAEYEFALCRQLQVTGFPTLLLQADETKFYLLARGFTPYQTVKERLEKVLIEISNEPGEN